MEELWQVQDRIAREHGYDIERLATYFLSGAGTRPSSGGSGGLKK